MIPLPTSSPLLPYATLFRSSFPTSASTNHFYIFMWWGPRFFCHLVPSVRTNIYPLDRAVLYGLALVALIGVGRDQWTFAIVSEHRTRPYIAAPLHLPVWSTHATFSA